MKKIILITDTAALAAIVKDLLETVNSKIDFNIEHIMYKDIPALAITASVEDNNEYNTLKFLADLIYRSAARAISDMLIMADKSAPVKTLQ